VTLKAFHWALRAFVVVDLVTLDERRTGEVRRRARA
jgi:hypothetical protein